MAARHYYADLRPSEAPAQPFADRLALHREVIPIEDDLSVSYFRFFLLEEMKYEGDEALKGREALARLCRNEFDTILLDARCMNDSGRKYSRRLIQIHPALIGRVLVIVAIAEDLGAIDLLREHRVFQPPPNFMGALLGRIRNR